MSNNNLLPESLVEYFVKDNNGTFGADRWSKAKPQTGISHSSLDDAMDHAKELRDHVYDGKMPNRDSPIFIKVVHSIRYSIVAPAYEAIGGWALCKTEVYGGVQKRTWISPSGEKTNEKWDAQLWPSKNAAIDHAYCMGFNSFTAVEI